MGSPLNSKERLFWQKGFIGVNARVLIIPWSHGVSVNGAMRRLTNSWKLTQVGGRLCYGTRIHFVRARATKQ
jgi:hypothetical protein